MGADISILIHCFLPEQPRILMPLEMMARNKPTVMIPAHKIHYLLTMGMTMTERGNGNTMAMATATVLARLMTMVTSTWHVICSIN